MQALLIDSKHAGGVRFTTQHPAPRKKDGEVLVRVHLAGICATDLELAKGYMHFRGVPGHEFVGTVARGPASLAGRRIVADINCACGRCDMCRAALPTHCRRRTVVGIVGRGGAFAETLSVPVRNCHVVPERVSDEQAVFVEPLAAAIHVLNELPRDRRLRVAVVGAGRLGLLVAAVLKARKYRLDVVGRSAARLDVCARWGLRAVHADEVRPAARHDAVVECSGSPAGLRLALQLVRPRGLVVLKSTYAETGGVDLAPIVIHEVRVIGSRCGAFPPALRMLGERSIDVLPLVSSVYPLSRGVEAFAAATRPQNIKILLRPGSL